MNFWKWLKGIWNMMSKIVCKKQYRRLAWIASLIILLFTRTISSYAIAVDSKEYLFYKHLYSYGERASSVLKLYTGLQGEGRNVFLLPHDKAWEIDLREKDSIIILTPNFDSNKEYVRFMELYPEQVMTDIELYQSFANKPIDEIGPILGIDKIYPFSDLNKLMDIADGFYDRGIEFVLIIMPVYENYQLEAYDEYIEVLKYLVSRGGNLFVHYPVTHSQGVYNLDPKPPLKEAIAEYRKRGLEVMGIKLSLDKVFNNFNVFNDLDLPFLLITSEETRINENLVIDKISEILQPYIMVASYKPQQLDIFRYKANNAYNPKHLVYIDINTEMDLLEDLVALLDSQEVPIVNFNPRHYKSELKLFYNISHTDGNNNRVMTQQEIFKQEELEKIRRTNLNQEEIIRYDISSHSNKSIKVALGIGVILLIYLYISRRINTKKYFK